MAWVTVGGVVLASLLVAVPAWSDETPRPTSPTPPMPPAAEHAPVEAGEPLDWARLASEFEALVLRYVRLIEFTQRIEAEREARDFEQARARYEKFEAFTRALEERRERELEREFEASVALHVRKQAFTLDLAARRTGD